MAACWEAVASGHRKFTAENILDLELTMIISALWYIRYAIAKDADTELYKMLGEWRDKLTSVRFALDPVTESSRIDHMKMVEMVREVGREIRVAVRLSNEYAVLFDGLRNSVMGIASALENLYFGKAVE